MNETLHTVRCQVSENFCRPNAKKKKKKFLNLNIHMHKRTIINTSNNVEIIKTDHRP